MPPSDPLPPGWTLTITGYRVSPQQRTFIESGLSRGMSGNAIIEAMRGTDFALRRQASFDVMAEIRGARLNATRANRAAANYVPTNADYQQINGPSKFTYRTTAKLDLSHLGVPFLGEVHAFSFSNAQLPLDTQRRNMYRQLSPLIQSIKAQTGDDSFDINPDDLSFVSFERFVQ